MVQALRHPLNFAVAAAALLVLGARLAAGERVHIPDPEADVQVRLDQALASQLEGRPYDAIPIYQSLVSSGPGVGGLVPYALRDPYPAHQSLVVALERFEKGTLEFDGALAREGELFLTRSELEGALALSRSAGGRVAVYRALETGSLPVENLPAHREETIYLSIEEYALRQIPRSGPGALEGYRELYETEARHVVEAARESRDTRLLEKAAREYVLTTWGVRALVDLADKATEEGRFDRAIRRLERILDVYPDLSKSGLDLAWFFSRLGFLYARAGWLDSLEALLARVEEGPVAEFLERELDSARKATRETSGSERAWSATRDPFPEFTGPLELSWEARLAEHEVAPPVWRRAADAPGARQTAFAYLAAVSGGAVVVGGQGGVAAFDLEPKPRRERMLWRKRHREGSRLSATRGLSRQEPSFGATLDGDLCFVTLDDFADVPSGANPPKAPPPTSTLFAIDSTGRMRWTQPRFRNDPAPLARKAYLVGPPVVEEGHVFVAGLSEQEEVYVFAFEAETGNFAWERYLCSVARRSRPQDDPTIEMPPVPSPLAASRGRLYLTTNLGVAACLSAETGRVEWLVRYARPYGGKAFREFHDEGRVQRTIPWPLSPPAVAGPRVFLFPTDLESGALRVHDARTGSLELSYPPADFNPRHRWLLGAEPGGPAFLGGSSVLALSVAASTSGPVVLWETGLLAEVPRARGGVSGRFAYLPATTADGREVIFRLSRTNGKILEEIDNPTRDPFGNIAVVAAGTPGRTRVLVISLTDEKIQVFEAKRP